MQDTARLVKEKPESVTQRVENILLQLKIVEKEAESLKTKIASMSVESLDSEIKSINGNQVPAKKVRVDSPAALRDLADRFKDKIKSRIIVLGTVSGSKVLLTVVVTKDLVNRYHAGKTRSGP